jgi:hypothetical protein
MTTAECIQLTPSPATSNGDYPGSNGEIINEGGIFIFNTSGTFDTGTMTLWIRPSGHSAGRAVADAAHDEPTGTAVYIASGDTVWATLSGAGTESITATLNRSMDKS